MTDVPANPRMRVRQLPTLTRSRDDGAMDTSTPDPMTLPWRVGRHVGRTIYAQGGEEASRDADVLIGVLDTPELAAEACAAHNALLEGRQA